MKLFLLYSETVAFCVICFASITLLETFVNTLKIAVG